MSKLIGRQMSIAIFGDVGRDHPIEDMLADVAHAAGELYGLDISCSSENLYEQDAEEPGEDSASKNGEDGEDGA